MQNLKLCPLFFEIKEEEYDKITACLKAVKKVYKKEQYIYHEGDSITNIGIIVTGNVQITKDDYWGNRTIITKLATGDIFGESFAYSTDKIIKVNVIALDNCTVLFIDFNKIITACATTCGFHEKLIKNMLRILANKNIVLTEKIEFVTKRSIREKVLAYLSAYAKQINSNKFIIPFNRQELADYLAIDRSALSRELSLMAEEGLIHYNKNQFVLNK